MTTTMCSAVLLGAVTTVLLQGRAPEAQVQPADLQGTWNGGTLTPLERPKQFAGRGALTLAEAVEFATDFFKRGLAENGAEFAQQQSDFNDTWLDRLTLDRRRTSLIVDPPTGLLPPLVPGADGRLRAAAARSFDNPESLGLIERCLVATRAATSQASPPMIPNRVFSPYYQIVQTPSHVLILSEWVHDSRIIRLNRAHLPPTIRLWLGDSIGQWEGRTLVVDTTNFRDDTRFAGSSAQLHVVERFTRTDDATIQYRVTVNDPETWVSPWTAELSFKATASRLFEYACHEGNRAVENYLRGARFQERSGQASAGAR